MRLWIVAIILAIALAAGYLFFRRPPTPASTPSVRVVKTPAEGEVTVRCRRCGATFKRSEAKPVPGRRNVLVCPQCGEPTPGVPAPVRGGR